MRKYTISIQLLSQYKDNIQNCCSVWYYLPIIIKSDILLSESEVLYEKRTDDPESLLSAKKKLSGRKKFGPHFLPAFSFCSSLPLLSGLHIMFRLENSSDKNWSSIL